VEKLENTRMEGWKARSTNMEPKAETMICNERFAKVLFLSRKYL